MGLFLPDFVSFSFFVVVFFYLLVGKLRRTLGSLERHKNDAEIVHVFQNSILCT